MTNPYPIAIADADSGVVKIAGAATFTDPANQPGGSFAPVTCLLQTAALDIHAGGQHPLLWSFLLDNPWDFNTLTAIPTGLGLTFAFNGSSATITTTAAGTWGFSLALSFANDATWDGTLVLDSNTQMQVSGKGSAANPRLAVSQVVTYPSGANFAPLADVTTPGTANPLNASGNLTIVRLG